jgi:cytoskeletal protein RodZ
MNGFTKKSIGTLTLGEKIKKLRSERRISLNEVSKSTRIQVKYLEYIEEGNYDKLPVDVYVKGFLKNYADFLGVDENIFIRLFEKERGIKKNIEKVKGGLDKSRPEPMQVSSFIITPKLIAVSSIIILALAGAFYLYREIGSFASVPRLVVLSPEQNAAISGNAVVVEGVTDKDAKLFINDQAILVNDEGKFRENLTLQPGANFINVKAINRFEKEVIQVVTVQADIQIAEEQNQSSNLSSVAVATEKTGVDLEISIDAGSVQVSVESDGNLVFNGMMLAGSSQSFKAENKISVDSSRANATFVKVAGKDKAPLGSDNKPIKGVIFIPNVR